MTNTVVLSGEYDEDNDCAFRERLTTSLGEAGLDAILAWAIPGVWRWVPPMSGSRICSE